MKKPDAQKVRFTRERKLTIINAILIFVVLIVILQLWLLTASMNALLGDDHAVLIPAALVSLGCLGLNAGLLWFVYRID